MRHRKTSKPSTLNRQAQMRVFVCDVCGVKTTVTKTKGKTIPGHIKDCYCFQCRQITKHTQIE